jgi:hypothetical protein
MQAAPFGTAQATRRHRVAVLSSVNAAEPSSWSETSEHELCRRYAPVRQSGPSQGDDPSLINIKLNMEPADQSADAKLHTCL